MKYKEEKKGCPYTFYRV